MKTKVVTAAIAINGNQIMIAKRGKGQSLEGYWEFPGGKLEPEENLQECLKRELLEELGVDANIGSIFCESTYEYESGKILLIALEAAFINDNFALTVHDELRWVPIKNLLDFKLAPADIFIAKKIQETYGI